MRHISTELVKEAGSLLDDNEGEIENEAQLHFLRAKLNTAFALSKDPDVNELRKRLEQKFGPI